MQAVKRMVGQVMRQQAQGEAPTYQPGSGTLEQQYLALIQQEVEQELAQQIVDQVHGSLKETDRDDEQACRDATLNALSQWLPTPKNPEQLEPTEDGRPRTIALVGPTGVGKTTTIAKLAATYKLKQQRSVGLVTLDTYRIAAVDQLRTYAGIIGLDLHVASDGEELQQAIDKLQDCEVVLIDTAGRSQKNDDRLTELAEALGYVQPHEVHLVLSSTCSERVLEQTVERFSAVRTDRIIFTKLDEAVTFGVVLNVARKVNKQLSFITTGQDVPHEIEPGEPKRLAELVLGEGEVSA
jgi:flagellar biosynthesis protein FlhF